MSEEMLTSDSWHFAPDGAIVFDTPASDDDDDDDAESDDSEN